MPKFIPLSTLKDTTFICDMCQQIKEPIFVTRNGYTELEQKLSVPKPFVPKLFNEYVARFQRKNFFLEKIK